MSRPNTPTMEKDTPDILDKAMEHEYSDSSDCESRSTLHSPNNRSPDRGSPTHKRGHNHITIPYVNVQRLSNGPLRSITSVRDMMELLIGDINAMIESAADIVETAHQIRTIVHHTLECIDLECPTVSQLGLSGTIKDIRRETVRTVIDADRAHLRYRKVLTEFLQLRRCLRRLGVIPTPSTFGGSYRNVATGAGCSSPSSNGHASYLGSAKFYGDFDDTG